MFGPPIPLRQWQSYAIWFTLGLVRAFSIPDVASTCDMVIMSSHV